MIEKNILKKVLLDNRSDIEAHQIIHREIPVGGFDCYVFVGARRSGKSFLLYERMQQLLREGHSWNEMLYINFEDDRLDGFTLADCDNILQTHLEMLPVGETIRPEWEKPILFLDEIQNVDGWEKFARSMADRKFKVWITGSNAKMLSADIMQRLGGRYLPIEVYPFSLREYMNARNVPTDDNSLTGTYGAAKFKREYQEYLRWGGLPESINLPVKRTYLSSLFQKIYLSCICSRHKIGDPEMLRLMLRKLAEGVKQPISYSRISNILSSMGKKMSVPTITNYIDYAQDAWLLLRVRNIQAPFAERQINCKYYFIDNGLLSLQLVDPGTALLENIVALQLFRIYGNDRDNERIFFYNNNIEVDFYIPEEELAIQVSWSIEDSDTKTREVTALQKLPKVQPCRRRIILTYDEENILKDEYGKIEVIPCWKWLMNSLELER